MNIDQYPQYLSSLATQSKLLFVLFLALMALIYIFIIYPSFKPKLTTFNKTTFWAFAVFSSTAPWLLMTAFMHHLAFAQFKVKGLHLRGEEWVAQAEIFNAPELSSILNTTPAYTILGLFVFLAVVFAHGISQDQDQERKPISVLEVFLCAGCYAGIAFFGSTPILNNISRAHSFTSGATVTPIELKLSDEAIAYISENCANSGLAHYATNRISCGEIFSGPAFRKSIHRTDEFKDWKQSVGLRLPEISVYFAWDPKASTPAEAQAFVEVSKIAMWSRENNWPSAPALTQADLETGARIIQSGIDAHIPNSKE